MLRFTPCLILLLSLQLSNLSVRAQIAAGPMVGATTMREAILWLQTEGPARVAFEYWPTFNPDQPLRSPEVQTHFESGFTAKIPLRELIAGATYEYVPVVDGEIQMLPFRMTFQTPPLYKDRTQPPEFTVALASGHYVPEEGFEPPYRHLGTGFGIAESILSKGPAFMIWLGNSVAMRESDWTSLGGYLARYRHNRAQADMRPLFAGVPQLFTIGPGEYGAPDATRFFWNRENALNAFEIATANPSYGAGPAAGVMTQYRWGDIDFFLLDTRSHRGENGLIGGQDQVLGEAQIEWLVSALHNSNATFRVVCSGVPALHPVEAPNHLREAANELEGLIDVLSLEEIPGLVFVSGGTGYGELTKRIRSGGYSLFDLSVGPLTAQPADGATKANFFREPATTTRERHFATLRFRGEEDARELHLQVFDAEGVEVWGRTITAESLR